MKKVMHDYTYCNMVVQMLIQDLVSRGAKCKKVQLCWVPGQITSNTNLRSLSIILNQNIEKSCKYKKIWEGAFIFQSLSTNKVCDPSLFLIVGENESCHRTQGPPPPSTPPLSIHAFIHNSNSPINLTLTHSIAIIFKSTAISDSIWRNSLD